MSSSHADVGVCTVLCLHGSQQSSEVFRTKLGNFIPKLKKICAVEFVDGPFECELRKGDEVATRTWYLREAGRDNKVIASSLETSLQSIETIWVQRGNVIGIIGFSMGGTLATIIAAHPHRFPGLRFILVAGAPDNSEILSPLSIPPTVYSMHIAGTKDVLFNAAEILSHRFNNPIFITHDKGHIIPTQSVHQRQYLDFIESHIPTTQTLSSIPHQLNAEVHKDPNQSIAFPLKPSSSVHTCSSDDIARAQSEEIEVLLSIYPSEILVKGSPPALANDACPIIHFSLPHDSSPSQSDLISRVTTHLSLIISFTSGYPDNEVPLLDLNTGALSPTDITLAKIKDLKALLTSIIYENAGTPLTFTCIQATIDWIDNMRNTSIKHELVGDEDLINIADETPLWKEEDEEQTSSWISLATEESYSVACKMKNAAHSDLIDDYMLFHEPPPPSARGIWRYTVGLVGKPSAGKSTFYNAVTKAALEREGRLMASVAPHPFTTIEPNIGPGWYASSSSDVEADPHRSSLHGRDEAGRRLLPVIVKDVAGLVPGAYKGRGKGNRFLADLCDADVLIHVVDVTGRSDKDGNILDDGDDKDNPQRSSPMEDAKWIREELHRWIYGNVYAKWSSVGRKEKSGERIAALFSGYKGPKSCIEKACKRVGLDIDNGRSWSSLDVHRLVANYLTIRFPICLALNKIDSLPPETANETVHECQRQAEARGEKAVPISARAESWNLLKQVPSDKSSNLTKLLPATGSKEWLSNEGCLAVVMERFGSTGVLNAISAAVSLRPPIICYPVMDIESEAPVGWTNANNTAVPRLRDCLQFKPGSTVGDVYDALKRGALSHVIVTGDFVRAEGKGVEKISRKKQFGRDTMLDSDCTVIRIQSNRKVVWQNTANN